MIEELFFFLEDIDVCLRKDTEVLNVEVRMQLNLAKAGILLIILYPSVETDGNEPEITPLMSYYPHQIFSIVLRIRQIKFEAKTF